MEVNPNFIVEIDEPSETEVTMNVWKAVDGEKLSEVPALVYNLKRVEGAAAEDICAGAAPHLFL